VTQKGMRDRRDKGDLRGAKKRGMTLRNPK